MQKVEEIKSSLIKYTQTSSKGLFFVFLGTDTFYFICDRKIIFKNISISVGEKYGLLHLVFESERK